MSEAITVAQINPEDAAFVAGALHPAAKSNRLANVVEAKFAAGMGTEHVLEDSVRSNRCLDSEGRK
ncbi:hypothetical protein GCM10011375_28520 [Hymenobacter qilianensis]|uniref:Uncharacterized protein n=1 Tax=Hymenobacter qilianensis TaxID=1385715 RepID=A0ACB5PTX7_9BACT|nr:hypothetical protein GCM10011375_28520 [Hymenobacter qilianensis]